MKLTITSLELKSPFHFFTLSYQAMRILKQLSGTNCVKKKTIGFWTKHYTMTLWEDEESLKAFARSGAHLDAMKRSARMAKEIRTLTIEADRLPDWREARSLLETMGRVISYS